MASVSRSVNTRPSQKARIKVPARPLVFALIVAILAPLASGLAVAQQTISMQDLRRTIVVAGEVEVMASPDQASVSASVHNWVRTAREAMNQTSRAMRALLDALKALGIEERDVRTANLNLQPVIQRQQPSGRLPVVGYTETKAITIRVRDLAHLDDVLDRVTTTGANKMHGLQLTVSDGLAKMDELHAATVAAASCKADIIAQAAGARLGCVVTLLEQDGMDLLRSRATSDVPIPVGE